MTNKRSASMAGPSALGQSLLSTDTAQDMHRDMAAARWRATALLASIVGAAASLYLLVEYLTGQPGICLTSNGCDLVRASAFAYPLGIPTPLFGLVFYLVAAWLVSRTLDARSVAGFTPGTALLGLALVGVSTSMVLTGLEAFIIKTFCSWCLVQAGASLVLVVAAVALPRGDPHPTSGGHSRRARNQTSQAIERGRRSLMRTARFGWAGVGLAVAALLVVGGAGGTPTALSLDSTLAPAGNPRLGAGQVEVVEFADFQCPACATVAPILANIASTDSMTLVSRYFPLDSIHANADSSARAAAAAAKQGSFWEMSRALYARQDSWKDLAAIDADTFFRTLAQDVGLDVAAWQAAYESEEIAAAVNADRQAAMAMGLNGTPTLFIGGRLYSGSISAEAIRAAVAAVAPAS